MNITRTYLKDLVYQVNGAAIEVHKNLGPGLLESVYHQCLKKELELRNIKYLSEFLIPLNYKSYELESNMNLLNAPIGLLINFNVKNIYYEGQKTIVNELYRRLED